MHDADAQAADFGNEVHGQPGHARPCSRGAGGDAARFAQDKIRPRHHVVGDGARIGAAASSADILGAGDLGFDVAAQRVVGPHGAFDRIEPLVLGIEPMEVAAVDDRDVAVLRRREPLDRVGRREVSVEAAGDVEDIGGKIRASRERRRIVEIVQRAYSARTR